MGPFSIADDLSQRLLRRWVPKWHEAFFDPKTKLFYERVGHGFKPILTGQRRLLTQFRQLAMYSHAAMQPESFMFRPDIREHFEFFTEKYRAAQPGSWMFSMDDEGRPLDVGLDLYGHAFVLFALSIYGRASGDGRACDLAFATMSFIDRNFRAAEGFHETLDPDLTPRAALRRHESHMHLLEACVFAHEAWGGDVFLKMAAEIAGLFFSRLYDPSVNVLSEYFTNDLRIAPDPQKGQIICEPGHYCEWIWLLKKLAGQQGDPKKYDDTCLKLLDWANTHGWDATYGGIYDELGPAGQIVADTKRLWPFCESLKANALMLNAVPDRDGAKDRMSAMTRLFRDSYMQERGFWTEWLSRDLTPAVDYMPATTPYHVYFGIMETRAILEGRGASKSLRAGPRRAVYATLRTVSAYVRKIRYKMAGKGA